MAEKSYRQLSTLDGTTPINKKLVEETNDASKDASDNHEYPGALSLIAIMTALYLAIFLVALVGLPLSIYALRVNKIVLTDLARLGSNHYRYGHSTYNRRFPCVG